MLARVWIGLETVSKGLVSTQLVVVGGLDLNPLELLPVLLVDLLLLLGHYGLGHNLLNLGLVDEPTVLVQKVLFLLTLVEFLLQLHNLRREKIELRVVVFYVPKVYSGIDAGSIYHVKDCLSSIILSSGTNSDTKANASADGFVVLFQFLDVGLFLNLLSCLLLPLKWCQVRVVEVSNQRHSWLN